MTKKEGKKLKIINVVGARPNFMKIAPIHNLMLRTEGIEPYLVHTGQHYDEKMSKVFFEDLGMPEPDVYLKVGSGSHAVQTAKIMMEFEKVVLEQKPDIVLVVGDVNSTVACTLVAVKLGIKTVHVESGLRSYDNRMPEEINRLMTDVVADYLFVSEESGLENLKKEGVPDSKVFHVGNVMIDSLINNIEAADHSDIMKTLGVEKEDYVLVTLHRPSNVDDEVNTKILIDTLKEVSKKLKIVFPIHPRTLKNLEKFGIMKGFSDNERIILTEPLGYLDFMKLMKESKLLLTDSGGIQEETTYLGKPCLTLRENTERPSTITQGTNILIPELNKEVILNHVDDIISGRVKKGTVPKYWDGRTAERIVEILLNSYGS
ncbi:MAG: UDP-N-acetylglucosamine 2-epimerase (non-hydrolyzing) [Candidatus Delongbacteria bacterium]|nr:UDP-N-acetylglucosamine 2-epimerase (non-hydrolyzing) [Candidatus Delongbacteria bacterium]